MPNTIYCQLFVFVKAYLSSLHGELRSNWPWFCQIGLWNEHKMYGMPWKSPYCFYPLIKGFGLSSPDLSSFKDVQRKILYGELPIEKPFSRRKTATRTHLLNIIYQSLYQMNQRKVGSYFFKFLETSLWESRLSHIFPWLRI